MPFKILKEKNQPAWLVILLILMFFGLLIFMLITKETRVITELEREIKSRQPTVALFSKEGNVQLFSPLGNKIKKCGKLEDLVTDEDKRRCGIGVGKVVAEQVFKRIILKVNPLCARDTIGGYVYYYHLDGPNIWDDPCHVPH